MQTHRQIVKNARIALSRTAFEQAQLLNATESKVYNVERGRCTPRRELALRWAQSLNLAPEIAFPELFDGEE